MTRDGRLPVINVAPLLSRDADARVQTSRDIERACRDLGFFYDRDDARRELEVCKDGFDPVSADGQLANDG